MATIVVSLLYAFGGICPFEPLRLPIPLHKQIARRGRGNCRSAQLFSKQERISSMDLHITNNVLYMSIELQYLIVIVVIIVILALLRRK